MSNESFCPSLLKQSIQVRNPECSKFCETSLRMPHSLMVQSRATIWKHLREADTINSGDDSQNYTQRLENLVKQEELPIILSDYLQCIN